MSFGMLKGKVRNLREDFMDTVSGKQMVGRLAEPMRGEKYTGLAIPVNKFPGERKQRIFTEVIANLAEHDKVEVAIWYEGGQRSAGCLHVGQVLGASLCLCHGSWRDICRVEAIAKRGKLLRKNTDRATGLKGMPVITVSNRAQDCRVPLLFVTAGGERPWVAAALIFLFKKSLRCGVFDSHAGR